MTNIKVPIEIPYALSIFAFMFCDSVSTNWMMYRTCYTIMGFNKSDCELLGSGNSTNSTLELEKEVQPYVTVISMVRSISLTVIAAVVCFFFGPWSDKYGRKPVLLLSYAGFGLSYAIMAIITAVPNLSPWYTLLSTLPVGLTGGFIAQLTAILCCITDTTSTSNRGIRLAIFETASTGGSLIGTLSSSFVFELCGYTFMFIIASCFIFVAFLIILFFIPESITNPETNGRLHNFFQISLLRKSIDATFKKRRDYNRAILLTIISVLLIFVFIFSEFAFTFLYLRKTFKWSLEEYTILSGSCTITGMIGSLIGVYILHTLLKVDESAMVLFGLISTLSGALVMGFATSNSYIYAGGSLKFLNGAISPMARSLVSKIALEDCGSVFGFLAVCETLMMLVGKFAYTYVYNTTSTTFPPGIYFFSAGFCLFAILLNIVLIGIQKQKAPVDYQIIEEDAR